MTQQNFLNSIQFKLVIDRLPFIEYFVQAANLPGVQINERIQPTPFKDLHLHGEKIEYSELNLTIKADASLKSYTDTYKWIMGLSYPDMFEQFKTLAESEQGLYSDMTLMLLDNRTNPIISFQFKDAFPMSLSDLQLDLTQTSVEGPTFDVVIKHNGMIVK